MLDRDRFVYVTLQIDTNRINARRALPEMNQLEAWHRDGVVLIHMSQVAQSEARSGASSLRSKKALSYIFSITYGDTPDEQDDLRAIEEAIFPGGAATEGERRDVEIAFNAKKYGAILVTNDGLSKRQPRGILGSRAALARIGVQVMTDSEAVEYVRHKIAERDKRMRLRAERDGTALPAWVGAD
jgi:hypothetical protein